MNNYFEIAAFTNNVFGGNVAAVQLLDKPISASLMQKLAAQNQQTETAFIFENHNIFHIRWFTPTYEIDLCGHATLAAAFVLFTIFHKTDDTLTFSTEKAGNLYVSKKSDRLTLDFPIRPGREISVPASAESAFGFKPIKAFQSRDLMLLFENQSQIENISPNSSAFKNWKTLGVICTAPGIDVDFVSRVFDANDYHLEDPVTGSAYCTLAPYWSARLNKTTLSARQLSPRQGELYCEIMKDRIHISGNAIFYKQGFVNIEEIQCMTI
jgi:PhzF family phenazine biosynthesis protein